MIDPREEYQPEPLEEQGNLLNLYVEQIKVNYNHKLIYFDKNIIYIKAYLKVILSDSQVFYHKLD